jgi:hypothetical protein
VFLEFCLGGPAKRAGPRRENRTVPYRTVSYSSSLMISELAVQSPRCRTVPYRTVPYRTVPCGTQGLYIRLCLMLSIHKHSEQCLIGLRFSRCSGSKPLKVSLDQSYYTACTSLIVSASVSDPCVTNLTFLCLICAAVRAVTSDIAIQYVKPHGYSSIAIVRARRNAPRQAPIIFLDLSFWGFYGRRRASH